MILKFVKEPFLAALCNGVEQNLSKYSQEKPWLSSHAMASGGIGETGLEIEALMPLDMPTGQRGAALRDLENAKKVYLSLKCLSVAQAQDHRLWAHLSHVEYWEYMKRRWPPESASVVRRRYLHEGITKDALVRNGISRLWWFGYLTYDTSRANPFELTEMLLLNQDIQQALLERAFGRNREVLHATLEFIRSNRERFEAGEGMSKNVQKLGVNINMLGGVCLLDCMTRDEIRTMIAKAAEFLESPTTLVLSAQEL